MEISQQQITLVESSAVSVDPVLEGFAAAFYARLFSQHPGPAADVPGTPGLEAAWTVAYAHVAAAMLEASELVPAGVR